MLLTLEVGGAGVTKVIELLIPDQTVAVDNPWIHGHSTPVMDGFYLRNAKDIQAFAGTTAVINLYGYVQRHN